MARPKPLVLRIVLTVALVAAGIAVMSIPRIVRSRRLPKPTLNSFAPLLDTGRIPADRLPLDSAQVMAALATVEDPELGFGIAELGLVHEITVDSQADVVVTLILTTPECPFTALIAERAMNALKQLPGARAIQVRIDPSIPWLPDRLTGTARARYDRVFGSDSGTGD